MEKAIHKDICNAILTALYSNKTINKATYEQAKKNINKKNGKEVA